MRKSTMLVELNKVEVREMQSSRNKAIKRKQIKINPVPEIKNPNDNSLRSEDLYRHKKNIYDNIRNENPYLN